MGTLKRLIECPGQVGLVAPYHRQPLSHKGFSLLGFPDASNSLPMRLETGSLELRRIMASLARWWWVVSERGYRWGGVLHLRTDDTAIGRTADFVLKRYGDDAAGFAARRVERLSSLGDMKGSVAWTKILRVIEDSRWKESGSR
jgi:hypothetical protein